MPRSWPREARARMRFESSTRPGPRSRSDRPRISWPDSVAPRTPRTCPGEPARPGRRDERDRRAGGEGERQALISARRSPARGRRRCGRCPTGRPRGSRRRRWRTRSPSGQDHLAGAVGIASDARNLARVWVPVHAAERGLDRATRRVELGTRPRPTPPRGSRRAVPVHPLVGQGRRPSSPASAATSVFPGRMNSAPISATAPFGTAERPGPPADAVARLEHLDGQLRSNGARRPQPGRRARRRSRRPAKKQAEAVAVHEHVFERAMRNGYRRGSLRKAGCSLRAIALELTVSKSSVSVWVRDLPRAAPKPRIRVAGLVG